MRPGNFSSVFSYIESMEILMLILLYYLSQNPDFPESVRPLMGQLKNSEEMLKFINDLSRFSDLFSALRRPGEKGDGGSGGSAGAPGKPEPPAERRQNPMGRLLRKGKNADKKKIRPPPPAGLRINLSKNVSRNILRAVPEITRHFRENGAPKSFLPK